MSLFYSKNSDKTAKNPSVHITLPICCHICLGKVKDPVLCSNNHVFCKFCLDEWLKNSEICPACRTLINEEKPYKKILGSLEDSSNINMNDPSIRTHMRRTRMKMIFEEFQSDMDCLEERLGIMTKENETLKEINTDLCKRINEKEEKSNNICKETEEISTILKLSSKLQQMIIANEELSRSNVELKKELQTINNERESMMKEIKRLQEDSNFNSSPHKYNKYAMVALQTKNDNYEREIQQWMKALKNADNIIEELTIDLEKYKNMKRMNAPIGTDLLASQEDFGNSLRSYPSCLEHSRVTSPQEIIDNPQVRDEIAGDNNSSSSYLYPACSKLVELTKAHRLQDNNFSSVRNLFPESTRRVSRIDLVTDQNFVTDRSKSCNLSSIRIDDNQSNSISANRNSEFIDVHSFSSKNSLVPDNDSSPLKKVKVEGDT
ncbi:ORC ubiquitin ligase 1 isoform X2 [Hydra vulgaris]|uniref:ORC ubiquitin ligase 1 isoform X2 n=1 Tax=Hydra vulgaris TaxID=6087 RepID=A0ABM4D5M3_HYDVU